LFLNHPVLEHHSRDQFYQKQKIMMTHHMNAIVEYPAVIATMWHRTDQNGQVGQSDGNRDFLLWPR
jgi:hypothetical protein